MKFIKYIAVYIFLMFFVSNISIIQGQNKNDIPRWLSKECQDSISRLNIIKEDLETRIETLETENKKNNQQVDNLTNDLLLEKYNSKIDNFLNLKDTTVFGSNFIECEEQVHPQRKDWYLLIESIRDLKNQLTINSTGDIFDVLETLNKNSTLEKAQQKILIINTYDCFDFLSEPQKQFYRQLIVRYNTLNKYANPVEDDED